MTFIWRALEGARFYEDDEDDVNDAKKQQFSLLKKQASSVTKILSSDFLDTY